MRSEAISCYLVYDNTVDNTIGCCFSCPASNPYEERSLCCCDVDATCGCPPRNRTRNSHVCSERQYKLSLNTTVVWDGGRWVISACAAVPLERFIHRLGVHVYR